MAVDGIINERRCGKRQKIEESVSKHQIQPEYGDERAYAGRDGRTRLARLNSLARTGTGENVFPCSADHEQDCSNHNIIIISVDAQPTERGSILLHA